ncbi:MAG: class II glutamine amidotransferase [Deltaproteobacteria bacterium]|nr:class II glutamine amidotransferase [Deltaproteobacteria bacterium]
MSMLLGLLSTHPDWLPCLLDSQHEVLRVPDPPQPGGWGIGFYQQGEVLRRLTPLERAAGPLEFRQLAHDVRSLVLVGHVRRASPAAPPSAANTHPFRFREWLFAHVGNLPRFGELAPRLLQNVPEFLTRNVAGETDSELLFHVILAHLNELGGLRHPDVGVDAVCEAVRRGIREADDAVAATGDERPSFALVLTNGNSMAAASRGESLCITQFDRLIDCRDCAQERRDRCGILRSERPDLRAVLVVAGRRPMPARYEVLPEESLIGIKSDATVEAIPLRPSALGLSGF